MRRRLLPATALLAALTVLALVGAAVVVRPPGVPTAGKGPKEAANRALAYAFYDAANAAIATGDPTPLVALVADDFVDRDAAPDPTPDRDGLVRRLLALRAADPDTRLVVETLAADGDLVIAHVRVEGAAPPTFLGLHLDGAWTAWGPVDVLRFERDRVVERRGPTGDPAPPPPALQVEFDLPSPEVRGLAVIRVTLAPGTRHSAPVRGGPRLVFAESGSVALDVEGDAVAAPGLDAGTPVTLGAGQQLLLPARAGFAARNPGRSSATLLDVAIAAPANVGGSPLPAAGPSEDGIAIEVVADGHPVVAPTGPVVLTVGRVTLNPGERLGWRVATGPVLLHVEVGTVDFTAPGWIPWARAAVDERATAGVATSLAAGDSIVVDAGAAAEVRASPGGPATLLVLTLLPAL